jgi:hypothetical protein
MYNYRFNPGLLLNKTLAKERPSLTPTTGDLRSVDIRGQDLKCQTKKVKNEKWKWQIMSASKCRHLWRMQCVVGFKFWKLNSILKG